MKGNKQMSRKEESGKKPMEELKETKPLATDAPESGESPAEETEEAAEKEENELEAMQQELDAANTKAAEYLALAQRVQADFENFRRRNDSVRSEAFTDGRKEVAAMMLPVLDNLERAVEAAADSTDESLKSGIEMVLKQMSDVYQKLDVKPIECLGEKFDPNLENAILQGTEEEGKPGTVCQVLQKGYLFGDKVLRHAMVKVVPE